MKTWRNFYTNGYGAFEEDKPERSALLRYWAEQEPDITFIRLEERWNGHALRPCVGMRASHTSHFWSFFPPSRLIKRNSK